MKNLIHFTDVEKADGQIQANLQVHPELPSFEGHFPGNPILPAVSIIDISLYLLSLIQKDISYTNIEVKRSKFMAMVHPKQDVTIVAQSDDSKNWRVLWTAVKDGSRLAQIHLVI